MQFQQFSFDAGSLHPLLTLAILAVAIYSFVRERIPPDLTALLALLALLVTGVLTPTEAFAGFSHPATVSVAAVLVLSAGVERTGALAFVARRVIAPFARWEWSFTAAIMICIGVVSAFINNTAAVAMFIPIVLDVCKRTGASPGRILMPMSLAATFGGMCTLIGTSTNLVAHEFARSQGLDGFSMFELGKVGLPILLAGFVYILVIGRWFLPHARPQESTLEHRASYLSELVIPPGSRWIGREVRAEHLKRDHELDLVALVRQGKHLRLKAPGIRYQAGDSLHVRGPLARVLGIATREGLEPHRPTTPVLMQHRQSGAELPLGEVVVLTTSGLIGQTLKGARFAELYDVVVLALSRRGDLHERPSTTPLHPGDVLIVEGESAALQRLAESPGFLVVGTPARPEKRPRKPAVALLTLVATVTLVSLGTWPIVTAATAGCAVLLLTGCLRPREAYRAIDLGIVFLLAGSLALGTALEKTGVTTALASGIAGLTGVTGPSVVLIGFFLVAMLISELMSNSGTVALLAPVAVSCATEMHVNPMALLAAVTFGASAAFAMPIGYQTSLMIYGPGGYRFKDFIRMGIALDILVAVLALWLIPRHWPLVMP